MRMKQILSVVLISAATSAASMWGYNKFVRDDAYVYPPNGAAAQQKAPANYAGFDGVLGAENAIDFTGAASAAIPATVHIKTKVNRTATNNLPRKSPFGELFPDFDIDDFFGDRSRSFPQSASGSGAIISEDGYIVTNNHVIDGADEINVTLNNKRSFKAKLVGADPSTDLAVIKIEAKGLPFLLYGNSDDVKVGQWVLAVGYPLTLETTVTAGIISAKGRTLDINKRQSATPVESFLQTDAAVNPGNSGGPLITTDGKLIGINSAIASPTGAFAGYSFTIPVNIVKKIIADVMKFGTVQRAYLGIQYPRENLSDEVKAQNGIREGEGVYVLEVTKDGAAESAGIKKGDVITKVNGFSVTNGPEMVGQIATLRP
ncbi:MAG: trypsin-like peptidase domain-containing protein, partial [Chitinophagaceae bacterium]|nr:trypsin-like peptidase domain-containing protein [Chitinophagaceae bacterium]